jgi:hypothetical protein
MCEIVACLRFVPVFVVLLQSKRSYFFLASSLPNHPLSIEQCNNTVKYLSVRCPNINITGTLMYIR